MLYSIHHCRLKTLESTRKTFVCRCSTSNRCFTFDPQNHTVHRIAKEAAGTNEQNGRAADRMVTRKATLSSGKILILCYRVRPEVCMRCVSVTAREVIIDDQGIKVIDGY